MSDSLEITLSLSELQDATRGLPAEFSLEDLIPASVDLDATIERDLQAVMQHGMDYPEALAVQTVWVRMYVAKLEHLQGMFEKQRH